MTFLSFSFSVDNLEGQSTEEEEFPTERKTRTLIKAFEAANTKIILEKQTSFLFNYLQGFPEILTVLKNGKHFFFVFLC